MNDFGINSVSRKREIEEQLKKLPKEKWKIWRLIVVGIFLPFIGPYIPMRKGSLVERMGYNDSALLFGGLCLVFIPIACYMHIKKINDEIFEAELELELLNRKKQIEEQLNDFKRK